MNYFKNILKLIIIVFLMFFMYTNVEAKVKWIYVKSPKYKTELKQEYKKIPKKARDVYDENNIKIKIYGYNHYKNWAGLFNGNINIESYKQYWLRNFFSRRGININSKTNKKLSIDYAKCTLIHELGHSYDYNKGWLSKKKDFKKIYKAEKNKFMKTNYYKYPMAKIKSNISDSQEYFASTFTAFVRSPKDLKKHCPKTYAYFYKHFKK